MHPSHEPAEPTYLPEPPPFPAEPVRRRAPWWRLQQDGSRRPWRRTLAVFFGAIVVISALGAPFGLLWAWLAPDVPVINVGDGGVVVNDPSPEQYVAADGWYTMLGFGFGVLVAIVAWLVLRRDRGPWLVVAVVVGTSLAAQRVAPFLGELIGRDAYDRWRETATQGATYLAPPEVHAFGPTLVPAFAAAIVLTLLAGWSNDPDLDQPGAQPGYGPNHPEFSPYPVYDPAAYQPDHNSPSSGSPDGPDPTAAPGPPAPGRAAPPPG
ncbi:hypothetical protein AB0M02_16130 [Actinoplanes sp. NPDC051861]|uniref:hypothetical protein n=1 Tax=Actinoplanes sp. NPDC051861 TaxID=3155170 RepID=UPI0034402B92